MAVTATRRRTKDPEGRMPLREHLAELRRRVIISVVAVAAGAVGGWYVYEPLLQELMAPLNQVAAEQDRSVQLNFGQTMSSLNIQVKLSVYLGFVLASPVWLYQVWAFITPGLTRKERRYSIGFVCAAVPLFLSGVALAWLVLPHAVQLLTDFTPEGAANFIDANDYISFATRLILAFGIAFVLPLLAVALNFAGLLTGEALGRQWRIAVFLCFLFSAIASPSPDAATMIIMTLPMIALYLLAVGICLLNDRRRRKRREADPIASLDDDEASPLDTDPEPDLRPTPIEQPGGLERT